MLNKKSGMFSYARNYKDIYVMSRFNKYTQNPRNFLSSKLISPTVLTHVSTVNQVTFMYKNILDVCLILIFVEGTHKNITT